MQFAALSGPYTTTLCCITFSRSVADQGVNAILEPLVYHVSFYSSILSFGRKQDNRRKVVRKSKPAAWQSRTSIYNNHFLAGLVTLQEKILFFKDIIMRSEYNFRLFPHEHTFQTLFWAKNFGECSWKVLFLLGKWCFEMPTLKISVLRAFILKYKVNVHLRHKKPSECRFRAFFGFYEECLAKYLW